MYFAYYSSDGHIIIVELYFLQCSVIMILNMLIAIDYVKVVWQYGAVVIANTAISGDPTALANCWESCFFFFGHSYFSIIYLESFKFTGIYYEFLVISFVDFWWIHTVKNTACLYPCPHMPVYSIIMFLKRNKCQKENIWKMKVRTHAPSFITACMQAIYCSLCREYISLM